MPSATPTGWVIGWLGAAALAAAGPARAEDTPAVPPGPVLAPWERPDTAQTEPPPAAAGATAPIAPEAASPGAAPSPGDAVERPQGLELPAESPASAPPTTQSTTPEGAVAPGLPPPKELDITADQQGFDLVINRFVATGQAKAQLAGGRLLADRIEYDATTRTLYASGSVRFQRGNQYLQASRLRYSLIEGEGEMEDVYGVLDLQTSLEDLDPEQPPAKPLTPPEPIACPTELPPIPDWHPHPWSATLWGGQMFHSDFGQTFLGQGVFRPEYVLGAGLQKRLKRVGPFALELDFNFLGHWASAQKGSKYLGPFTSSEVIGLSSTAQSFGEFTGGIGLRAWLQPWLSLGFVQGVSINTNLSSYEDTYRRKSARFLNYLGVELEGSLSPQWSLVGRIHHRSGAFGVYNGVREGSNAYLLGLRYRFGRDQDPKQDRQVALLPARGCANRREEPPDRPRSLPEALEQVAMGGLSAADTPRPRADAAAAPAVVRPAAPSFRTLRQQERTRMEAINRIEQRIADVQEREGLVIERRRGGGGGNNLRSSQDSDFGSITPPQVRQLRSGKPPQAVSGTLTHLRYQAPRIVLSPNGWRASRASFSNDPFTPAQSWMDADDVVVTQDPNGDTLIESRRNRLLLEDRLPIPVTSTTRIRKQQEVENRWVLGFDREDRDGFYVGRRLKPIRIGKTGTLRLEPQFLVERAYRGTTDSYPLPGESAGGPAVTQNNQLGDLFGLEARLQTPLLGFTADLNLDMSTFNPTNIANGTRSWGELERSLRLPLVGDTKARIFGAYRFRIWNGTLGEQDVYSAYGTSIEKTGTLPPLGRLQNSYFWRAGVGNYQSNEFLNQDQESQNFAQLWRANAFLSLNSYLPIWQGKALASTPDAALRYSPVPIVPGFGLQTNISLGVAYYGDGNNQNTLSFSSGATLTLGHFSKPFFDFTQLAVTGSVTVRQGQSPFAFDRAVDLGTIGIGLTQQLVGPLVLSGGVGVNVDSQSPNFGESTGSYVELRWQRRSYALSVFYSPYEGIGGVRVKLNDFGFSGTGVPFVPYQPNLPLQQQNRLF